MTNAEARGFIARGHAHKSTMFGWQIAHVLDGELEWFTVDEADGDCLDRASREIPCP